MTIGTLCFVSFRRRIWRGVVVDLWSPYGDGKRAIRVETAAAAEVYRPWPAMSFWENDGRGIACREALLIVPRDEAQRASLEVEAANPPPDPMIAARTIAPIRIAPAPQFPPSICPVVAPHVASDELF